MTPPTPEDLARDNEHECVFPEEQEPNGRLILAPCLGCNTPAIEVVKEAQKLREQNEQYEARIKSLESCLKGDELRIDALRNNIQSLEALLDEQNTIIELAKKLVDPNNKNDYENFICLEKAFQKLNSVKGK